MAKAKASEDASISEAAGQVNGQIVDAVTLPDMNALVELQEQSLKGMLQMVEIGMQSSLAMQQLAQGSLGLMEGLYQSYFDGMTHHSWAAYGSIWDDPWGVSRDKA